MVPLGNYGRGNPWIPVADGCRRLVGLLLADLRSARTQSGKARQQEGIEGRTMNAAKELQPEAHRQPLRNRSTPCAQQCPTADWPRRQSGDLHEERCFMVFQHVAETIQATLQNHAWRTATRRVDRRPRGRRWFTCRRGSNV